MAQAKDLHESIDLQTRYVQPQMKWYAEQTEEFGRLMTRALGDMKRGPKLKTATTASATIVAEWVMSRHHVMSVLCRVLFPSK